MPLSLHRDDLDALTRRVRLRLPDLVDSLPEGRSLDELIIDLAPDRLLEVQTAAGAAGASWGDGSALPDSVLAIVFDGLAADLVASAYMELKHDEAAPRIAYFRDRFQEAVARLALGGTLPEVTAAGRRGRGGMVSQPRQFTLDREAAEALGVRGLGMCS